MLTLENSVGAFCFQGSGMRMRGVTQVTPPWNLPMFYALYWYIIYVPVGSQLYNLLSNTSEQL